MPVPKKMKAAVVYKYNDKFQFVLTKSFITGKSKYTVQSRNIKNIFGLPKTLADFETKKEALKFMRSA